MSWDGLIESVLHRVLTEPRYATATNDEIVELVVVATSPLISWPTVERRLLLERVSEQRGGEAPVGQRPSGPKWEAIAIAYLSLLELPGRPTHQMDAALRLV